MLKIKKILGISQLFSEWVVHDVVSSHPVSSPKSQRAPVFAVSGPPDFSERRAQRGEGRLVVFDAHVIAPQVMCTPHPCSNQAIFLTRP